MDTYARPVQSHASDLPPYTCGYTPSGFDRVVCVPLLPTPSIFPFTQHVYITLAEDDNHHNTLWCPKWYSSNKKSSCNDDTHVSLYCSSSWKSMQRLIYPWSQEEFSQAYWSLDSRRIHSSIVIPRFKKSSLKLVIPGFMKSSLNDIDLWIQEEFTQA